MRLLHWTDVNLLLTLEGTAIDLKIKSDVKVRNRIHDIAGVHIMNSEDPTVD